MQRPWGSLVKMGEEGIRTEGTVILFPGFSRVFFLKEMEGKERGTGVGLCTFRVLGAGLLGVWIDGEGWDRGQVGRGEENEDENRTGMKLTSLSIADIGNFVLRRATSVCDAVLLILRRRL